MTDIITKENLQEMRADHIRKNLEKRNVHIHSQVCQITRAIIEENNNGKSVVYIKYLYNEDPEVLSMIAHKLQEKFVDSLISMKDDPMYQKNTILTVNWSDNVQISSVFSASDACLEHSAFGFPHRDRRSPNESTTNPPFIEDDGGSRSNP